MIEVHVGPQDRPETHGRNRRCRTCPAFLSMYNPTDRCSVCEPAGLSIPKFGGRNRAADVLDFQEWTEGINFGAMMEDVA